jgi:hypothetical protein
MSTFGNAKHAFHRWCDFCRHGMWLANLSYALGEYLPPWHIHAHCVVDDFGNLVPVAFSGMTATNALVEVA